MKRVIILGATGSIGKQAIDIINQHKDRFVIVGMSAHSRSESLMEMASFLKNKAWLCMSSPHAVKTDGVDYYGPQGLKTMIYETEAEIVINAIAGSAGLASSIDILESGKDLALANKETVVMASSIVFPLASKMNKRIIPVDSEHSAVFNMVERFGSENIKEVILTASGGAFRDIPEDELPFQTVESALKHPTWDMGVKITIDSASMANKGLEVIEAARLFNLESKRIKVLIHTESMVHSFIRTIDGSLYAQVSKPDMRLPILNALSWPAMIEDHNAGIDLEDFSLNFRQPSMQRYPLLELARQALESGEGFCCAYNAANEVAVDKFIQGRIGFTDIPKIVSAVLSKSWPGKPATLDDVFAIDSQARIIAMEVS